MEKLAVFLLVLQATSSVWGSKLNIPLTYSNGLFVAKISITQKEVVWGIGEFEYEDKTTVFSVALDTLGEYLLLPSIHCNSSYCKEHNRYDESLLLEAMEISEKMLYFMGIQLQGELVRDTISVGNIRFMQPLLPFHADPRRHYMNLPGFPDGFLGIEPSSLRHIVTKLKLKRGLKFEFDRKLKTGTVVALEEHINAPTQPTGLKGYEERLRAVQVGGRTDFCNPYCKAFLDSASAISQVPSEFVLHFRNEYNLTELPDTYGLFGTYDKSWTSWPNVAFEFFNREVLVMKPEDYVLHLKVGKKTANVLPFTSQVRTQYAPWTISQTMMKHLVTKIDVVNNVVEFTVKK